MGKDVISDTAHRLGKVKDIGYDSEGRIVLIYDDEEGNEEAVPSTQIIALGDVILVKSETKEITPTTPQTQQPQLKTCPKCGKANAPNVRFCTACGSKLE